MKLLLPLIALLSFAFISVLLLREPPVVPVAGASANDWNSEAFWHPRWGASGVHKGIDIFAPAGTEVRAATSGLVVYSGTRPLGGNVAIVVGPGWLAHYYAHLSTVTVRAPQLVRQGEAIGHVGTSGNAAGKTPHLHYSVMSLLPAVDDYEAGPQGWKRMFYRDPSTYLSTRSRNATWMSAMISPPIPARSASATCEPAPSGG